MLKKIISLINQKHYCFTVMLFLSACTTSSNLAEQKATLKQELAQTLLLRANANANKVHKLTKQLVQSQDWNSAVLGYQWLCHNSTERENSFCALMWSSAKQSNNNIVLFEAAATNYSLNKTKYWLDKSQYYATNEVQKNILKTLQSIPLTHHELGQLIDHPAHYAQAMFLKGKTENNIDILHQAKELFIQLKNWQRVADSLLVQAQITLRNQQKSKASYYLNEAILYYDLANANEKIDFSINWGRVNGITW